MRKKIKIFLFLVLVLIFSWETTLLDSSLKQRQKLNNQLLQISNERQRLKEELNKQQEAVESLKELLEIEKGEVLQGQARVKNLEGELTRVKENIDGLNQELEATKNSKLDIVNKLEIALKKIKELEAYKAKQASLGKKLGESSKSLSKKHREILELERKLNKSEKTCAILAETNKSLVEKNKELEELRGKLLKQAEEHNAQKQSLAELSNANEGFRKQMTQISEILTGKELELVNQKKEMEALRVKVSELESQRVDLDTKLNVTQAEQEKTTKLISEVAQLNTALEEKITQLSEPLQEKNKAEELKRKVEVILTPQTP